MNYLQVKTTFSFVSSLISIPTFTLILLQTYFFPSLSRTHTQVEDQMVLLQSCWSELLVLDHLCRQVTYGKEGCIYLVTGQQVKPLKTCGMKAWMFVWAFTLKCVWLQIEVSTIMSQAGATLSSLVSRTQDLVSKLKALHFDRHEFVCLKYLVLFNPGELLITRSHSAPLVRLGLTSCRSTADVKLVQNRRQVEQTQERVNRALMAHTQHSHPGHSDKFGQLLLRLPEVRSISLQVEEYLYQRHLLGDLPCNSLLTEMLHTKHSWEGPVDLSLFILLATEVTSCLGTFIRSANVCDWGGVVSEIRWCFTLKCLILTAIFINSEGEIDVVFNQIHLNMRSGFFF